MDKYTKAVLAVLFLIAAPLVSAEVRITERDTEKIYQSLIANETWLSEVEVGSTVFERSWIDGATQNRFANTCQLSVVSKSWIWESSRHLVKKDGQAKFNSFIFGLVAKAIARGGSDHLKI